jgi:hypothetical protein
VRRDENFPPSFTDFLEIWKPEPPGTLRACPDLSGASLHFTCSMAFRHDRKVSVGLFNMTSNLSKTIKESIVGNIRTFRYDCRQRHAL